MDELQTLNVTFATMCKAKFLVGILYCAILKGKLKSVSKISCLSPKTLKTSALALGKSIFIEKKLFLRQGLEHPRSGPPQERSDEEDERE